MHYVPWGGMFPGDFGGWFVFSAAIPARIALAVAPWPEDVPVLVTLQTWDGGGVAFYAKVKTPDLKHTRGVVQALTTGPVAFLLVRTALLRRGYDPQDVEDTLAVAGEYSDRVTALSGFLPGLAAFVTRSHTGADLYNDALKALGCDPTTP